MQRMSHATAHKYLLFRFPSCLWEAMASPGTFDNSRALESDLENIPLRGDGEGVADDNLAAVDQDDVEMLLAVLRARLAPFSETAERDRYFANNEIGDKYDPRVAFIAMYRDGQRRVLEDSVGCLDAEIERRAQHGTTTAGPRQMKRKRAPRSGLPKHHSGTIVGRKAKGQIARKGDAVAICARSYISLGNI